jgi:hypothetical protein
MINYQKDFDLHMTVDLESSGLFKARSVFGSSTVYEYDDIDEVHAIAGLNDQLGRGLIYKSLNRDPLLSLWPLPIPPPSIQAISAVFDLHIQCGSCVESSNGISLYTFAYTETSVLVLVPYQVLGAKDNHWDAIDNLIKFLDMKKVFKALSQFPTASAFPHTGKASAHGSGSTTASSKSSGGGGSASSGGGGNVSSNPKSVIPQSRPNPRRATSPPTPISRSACVPAEVKKKQLKRRLPSHIIDIAHPACQDVCTSWDIFGKRKCKNMCEWRNEV